VALPHSTGRGCWVIYLVVSISEGCLVERLITWRVALIRLAAMQLYVSAKRYSVNVYVMLGQKK